MVKYYWEIVEFDGTVTQIPPEAHDVIQRRWDNNQAIHTTNHSIPANQIKKFRITDKPYGEQPLLEAAAQAFRQPVYHEDAVVARWVKRSVPQQMYNRRYAGIPAYRSLGENNGMIMMAFRVPVHLIDVAQQTECTEDEVHKLDKN